jgi:hypothetical protein
MSAPPADEPVSARKEPALGLASSVRAAADKAADRLSRSRSLGGKSNSSSNPTAPHAQSTSGLPKRMFSLTRKKDKLAGDDQAPSGERPAQTRPAAARGLTICAPAASSRTSATRSSRGGAGDESPFIQPDSPSRAAHAPPAMDMDGYASVRALSAARRPPR